MTQLLLFNVTNGLIIGAFYVLMALGLSLIGVDRKSVRQPPPPDNPLQSLINIRKIPSGMPSPTLAPQLFRAVLWR